MKWIFLTLAFVNVVYFGYQWSQPGDDAKLDSPHPNASSAGGVQLLGERRGQSDRDQEVEQILQNPVLADDGASDSAERAVAEAGSPFESTVESTVDSTANNNRNAATGQQSTQPPKQASAQTSAETQPVEAVSSCWRVGEFSDVTRAQDISERLTAVDLGAEIKAIDAPTGDYDYRVVIPPMASMQEAFRRLRELKNRNIDSYVMTQGQNAQGISLGLFSTEAAASRHQTQMAGLGYSSEILSIARVSRGYWVFTAAGVIPASMIESIQQADQAIEITETDCLN